MIKEKILESLNDKNFYTDPFPHFRIYDLLDAEMHQNLFEKYMDMCNITIQPFGAWNKNISGDPVWYNELCELWDSADQISTACKKFLCLPEAQFKTLSVSMPKHYGSESNQILKDWHYDGSDKLLNMIYYLGTGKEKFGAIELKHEKTEQEKSYPYCANSMIIWVNRSPGMHRFRQTDVLKRHTVYVNYVPKDK